MTPSEMLTAGGSPRLSNRRAAATSLTAEAPIAAASPAARLLVEAIWRIGRSGRLELILSEIPAAAAPSAGLRESPFELNCASKSASAAARDIVGEIRLLADARRRNPLLVEGVRSAASGSATRFAVRGSAERSSAGLACRLTIDTGTGACESGLEVVDRASPGTPLLFTDLPAALGLRGGTYALIHLDARS